MAALEEDDNLDEEIFQDTALLAFPPEVQSVIDEVYTSFKHSHNNFDLTSINAED